MKLTSASLLAAAAFILPSSPSSAQSGPQLDPRCAALVTSGLPLPEGIDIGQACQDLLREWTNRRTVPSPPLAFDYTVENAAFMSALQSSLNRNGGRHTVLVNLDQLSPKVTAQMLQRARAPDYSGSELGRWLDRISTDHNGVHTVTDEQGLNLAPLVFRWVLMPLFSRLFARDPYSKARQLDAIVVTYGASDADAGAVKRICFVNRQNVARLKAAAARANTPERDVQRQIAGLCPA